MCDINKEQKKCNMCQKEQNISEFYFDTKNPDGRKYTCANCLTGEKIIKECKSCSKIFKTRYKHTVYCSKTCSPKIGKSYQDINCTICSQIFTPKTFKSKYCSKKCKGKSDTKKRSKKPIIKKCKTCNKEFKPYTSLDKFCSLECRVESSKTGNKRRWTKEQIEKRIGKKNPAYRNGMYTRTNNKTAIGLKVFQQNRKEIIDSMINSVGYVYCQSCNTSNSPRFEAHHLIFRSEKPNHKNLHDKENILLVCIKCHNEFHKNKSKRNEIVENRNLQLLFGNDVLNKK